MPTTFLSLQNSHHSSVKPEKLVSTTMLFDKRKKRKYSGGPTPSTPVVASLSPPPPYAVQTAHYPYQPDTFAPPYSTQPKNSQTYTQRYEQFQFPQPPQVWAPPNGPPPTKHASNTRNRTSTLYEAVADKFSDAISLIDEECFGGERELIINLPESPVQTYSQPALRGGQNDQVRALIPYSFRQNQHTSTKDPKNVNVFSKLDYYLNSRLPKSLPPLRLYMPTYPLLCLAAQYSASAYISPQTRMEKKDFVRPDGRLGTKAMVLKSVPCDDKQVLVFAIRGTSALSLRDWGVNLNTEPVSPTNYLDDPGNLVHAGFLKVAKAMVKPIAARLRQLLQENPNRSSCSLLITGHSAGGSVASLLYSHMLATTVTSELTLLTNYFKRVHCITFGAPPVSLLPLQKPNNADPRLRKCLFHSFINEGDPVVRADKAYVRSLVDLLSTSAPTPPPPRQPQQKQQQGLRPQTTGTTLAALGASMSRLDLTLKPPKKPPRPSQAQPGQLWWDVPPATLSNSGRLVVLRVPQNKTAREGVTASIVTDEQLRCVIFGDPLMHQMEVYRSRVEALAVRAVTGRLCEG